MPVIGHFLVPVPESGEWFCCWVSNYCRDWLTLLSEMYITLQRNIAKWLAESHVTGSDNAKQFPGPPRLWCPTAARPTCGHPGTDGHAPLIAEDGVDADQVLHARLQLLDSGCLLVSWHTHVQLQPPWRRGHVGDEVLSHHHLVDPGEVHRLGGHLGYSEVLGWRDCEHRRIEAKLLHQPKARWWTSHFQDVFIDSDFSFIIYYVAVHSRSRHFPYHLTFLD